MFWDRISSLYDLFETVYNGKVYRGTGEEVARLLVPTDHVLECACGTGAISIAIARRCARLLATDFSDGMLRRAERKLKGFDRDDARLTAVESRSSSPVRVLRDENMDAIGCKGVIPAGEGPGDAGGIMSAAVDGIRAAEKVIAAT